MDTKDILRNIPSRIESPEHPCYGFASVVNGNDVAIHKNEISAVLTAIGGQFVGVFAQTLGCVVSGDGKLATGNAMDFYNMTSILKRVIGEDAFENLMTLLMMYEDSCTKHQESLSEE
jgi:hypothetical protein